jgi:hypothetical protein
MPARAGKAAAPSVSRAPPAEAPTIRPATVYGLKALHKIAGRAAFKLLDDHFRPRAAERRPRGAGLRGRARTGRAELVEAGRYYVAEIDGVVAAGSGWSVGGAFGPVISRCRRQSTRRRPCEPGTSTPIGAGAG